MRTTFRVLAYLIAALVVVQAGAMAFGVAGLDHAVQTGGVLDRSAFDGDTDAFPEVTGLIVHSINGSALIPLVALLLLVSSVFAKVPRGSWWAGGVFALVAVQATLGFSAGDLPALGALHGVNALLLFTAALFAGRRARVVRDRGAVDTEPARTTAQV
jgi:heme A synthase